MQEILPTERSLESLKTLDNLLIEVFKEIQGSSRSNFDLMDKEGLTSSYQGISGHNITSYSCANKLEFHSVVKQPEVFQE